MKQLVQDQPFPTNSKPSVSAQLRSRLTPTYPASHRGGRAGMRAVWTEVRNGTLKEQP